MTRPEFLIVGSGLTGAVIARRLVERARTVLVVDRRSHIGGNVHDSVHSSGLRVHTYGPHYFRTNNEAIWKFVNQFDSFYPFEAVLASWVDHRFEHWPVTADYIGRTVGSEWAPTFRGTATNFEEASLSMMPEAIYRKFVRGYTEKQWGMPATALSADLAGRFSIEEGSDYRLKKYPYQGLPRSGYEGFMSALLAGIRVELGCDYFEIRERIVPSVATVFTGPIDEYFGFRLGRLAYRGQHREHTYLPDVVRAQPYCQVNNPDPEAGEHVRTIEWKHLMEPGFDRSGPGTVITREVPFSPCHPDRYEYPVPDGRNKRLYERYRTLARSVPGLVVCGRLGEYRYYDMDQAIGRANIVARRLTEP